MDCSGSRPLRFVFDLQATRLPLKEYVAANCARGSFATACVLELAADLPAGPMKDFRQMKQRGEKITALTAYDYPTARLLEEICIDIVMVVGSHCLMVLDSLRSTR